MIPVRTRIRGCEVVVKRSAWLNWRLGQFGDTVHRVLDSYAVPVNRRRLWQGVLESSGDSRALLYPNDRSGNRPVVAPDRRRSVTIRTDARRSLHRTQRFSFVIARKCRQGGGQQCGRRTKQEASARNWRQKLAHSEGPLWSLVVLSSSNFIFETWKAPKGGGGSSVLGFVELFLDHANIIRCRYVDSLHLRDIHSSSKVPLVNFFGLER